MAQDFILSSASAHKFANIIRFLHTSNTFRESLVLLPQMWAGSFILIRSNVYWETLVYFVGSPFAASRCNDVFLAIMIKCLDISTFREVQHPQRDIIANMLTSLHTGLGCHF